MNNTIHDKTDEWHWSSNVSDWEEEFNHKDIVLHLDPLKRLGEETYSVSRINNENPIERVQQLGIFWNKEIAETFAQAVI